MKTITKIVVATILAASTVGAMAHSPKPPSPTAIEILNYIVGNITFTRSQLEFADLNGDGDVNITDAVHLLRDEVGLNDVKATKVVDNSSKFDVAQIVRSFVITSEDGTRTLYWLYSDGTTSEGKVLVFKDSTHNWN